MVKTNSENSDVSTPKPLKGLRLEDSAAYRIRVQGHVDDSWSDRLGGMVITRAFTVKKEPMTILIGRLIDQASLSSVLNALYNQHLPVISVELLDER